MPGEDFHLADDVRSRAHEPRQMPGLEGRPPLRGCDCAWDQSVRVAGYGAFSVSQRHVSAVERYVSQQKHHHLQLQTDEAWEPETRE